MEKNSNIQPEIKNDSDSDRAKKLAKSIQAIIAKGLLITGPYIGLGGYKEKFDPTPVNPGDKNEQVKPEVEENQETDASLRPESEISPEQLKLYNFCKKHLPDAISASKSDPNKPMLPILLLAMSAHETGFGESELAKNANNFFGVIAKDGWEGEIYEKLTNEFVPENEMTNYEKKPGFKIIKDEEGKVIKDEKGNYKVQYVRPFRKYTDSKASFVDAVVSKIYHQNQDGSYRYQEAVDYLRSGGIDPSRVAELIGPNDKGRPAWATDINWAKNVQKLINEIDDICIQNKNEKKAESSESNESNSVVDVNGINFDELTDQSDKPVIERMKKAFEQVSLERFDNYRTRGITKINKEEYIAFLNGERGKGRTPSQEYEEAYSKPLESFDYIIFHIMAIDGGSENITLRRQLISWFNSRSASTQWLMSDNDPVDVWQVAPTKSGNQAWHIASGIKDSGRKGRENASNRNSVGIEVQANNIYNVKEEQFEILVYWAADLLIDSGKVNKEMANAEIDEVVNKMVIGHGQNVEDGEDSGLEFGYDYVKPIQDAIKQLVQAELSRN